MLQFDDILHKYIDENSPANPVELIQSILEKMKNEPEDYLRCIYLLTDIPMEQMKLEDEMDYLTCFIQGFTLNKYMDFIGLFKKMGLS